VSSPSPSPTEEYTHRLQAREQRVRRFEKIHLRLGNLRLLLVAFTFVVLWESFERAALSGWWSLLPAAFFVAAVVIHAKVLRQRSLAERAADVYRKGLARIADRWVGTGPEGEPVDTSKSLYAKDLDLFGRGSVFQLLSQARTRMGEETLAHWLLAFPPLPEIMARQAAVAELRDRLDLREDIAVLGEGVRIEVNVGDLSKWAETPNHLPPILRWLCPLLALAAIATAILWGAGGQKFPFFTIVLLEGIVFALVQRRVKEVLHSAQHTFEGVQPLAPLLKRLESETFSAARLQTIRDTLSSPTPGASRALRRFSTIIQCIYALDNQIFRLFDIPLMYSIQIACAGETWRAKYGIALRSWFNSIGELEALLSLAGYSYDHPQDPFPQFVDETQRFSATQLGHPLIPAAKCIRNDVGLSKETRLLLISGSNMSGKSTLLRTIGVNTVFAMIGAPVRAQRLQMTCLELGASILVNDSLLEGSSRFYAEINRLRDICAFAREERPLLFLLDELLQGTNSHDRLIGAEGVVRTLIDAGAIGLISTHDLALTQIGSRWPGEVRNMHFQDDVIEGKMSFSFKLNDGVVTKNNGLELMRLIGLRVT